ncbi:MAG: hypothetical protein HYZ74_05245 [Elusimicrobia bacterium]|nr:hypothetical protein [Elusimicrobiota bacterium]
MKYWVYMQGEVPGSYEPGELAAMPDFAQTSMVCPAEGEAGERNWQRAGQFPEIVEAINQAAKPSPLIGAQAQDAAASMADFVPRSSSDVFNDAGARIFAHVTELMKELENRREERALTQSLQRQVIELKNEVMAARERIKHLESQAALIPGYEDREKKLQDFLGSARSEIKEKDRSIGDLNRQVSALRQDVDRLSRSETSLSADLKHQAQIADDLSRKLAEKELALAKAFSLIRRLEEALGGLLPASAADGRREASAPQVQAAQPPLSAAKTPKPSAKIRSVLASEPPRSDAGQQGGQARSEPAKPLPYAAAEAGANPPKPETSPSNHSAFSSSMRSDERPDAFTLDSGTPEAPVPTPPEGKVKPVPVPVPWQDALQRISGLFREKE